MKNENMPNIEDVTDNEIVGYKIDDLVEAFANNNDESFVRRCLEEYFDIIYALGFASGKTKGLKLVRDIVMENVKNDTVS